MMHNNYDNNLWDMNTGWLFLGIIILVIIVSFTAKSWRKNK